jgi:hypothetical protein
MPQAQVGRIEMTKMTRRVVGASAVALLLAGSFATAQAPQIVRIRATIEKIDGTILDVKARDGAMMKVKLADNGPVNEVVKASLADIKEGAYIAITAMPEPDGSQKAVAILIFPEALRGLAEGFRPWDLEPNSTMTNATVANKVTGVDGETLTVKYKDGEKKIIVPPNAEIVAFKKASWADLKPGQKIFVAGAKKLDDGTLEAPNIAFGDYGVWR